MNRISKILTIVIALVAIHNLSAQTVAPFADGEKLEYAVCYRAKMVPKTPVGRATLKCKELSFNNTPHYRITANGRTLPFFRWFYDLNDTYTAHIEAASMRPTKLQVELRENKYSFDAGYDYDWANNQVNTSWKKGTWKQAKTKTMALGEQHYDPVALFYNLRMIDPATYQKDVPVDLHMVLEDTIRVITYSYMGEDEVRLKGIGRVPAHKFTCSIATSNDETFKDGTHFFLWLSTDENRIPLWIESPIRVGSVVAYLTKYDNLREELKTTPK
ncbi:MAG: DUF3108 domain-containing protein [Rikenellaceae bacterium]|nr:DUF3108 domain-containing protein [Rikenellaceae bacterium]